MPFILNLCRKGKRIALCVLFIFFALSGIIASPRSSLTKIDSNSRKPWDSLVQQVVIRDTCLGIWVREINDTLNGPKHDTLSQAQFAILSQRELFLKNQKARLDTVLFNFGVLDSSDVVYSVSLSADPKYNETGTSYDTRNHRIVFNVVGTATFVHETTHGGQFEKGSIAYKKDTGGPFGEDIEDEMDAYRAEFAYDPDSVRYLPSIRMKPVDLSMITARWVRQLKKPDGSMIYSCGGSAKIAQSPVNVSSPRKTILKAYRCLAKNERMRRWPPGYVAATDPNLFYKMPRTVK